MVHREGVFSGNVHRIQSDNEKVSAGSNLSPPLRPTVFAKDNMRVSHKVLQSASTGRRPSFKQAKTVLKFRVSKDGF